MVIAAEAVMGRTAKDYDAEDPFKKGSVARMFRDQFRAGRETAETCEWNNNHIPDPELGCKGSLNLFNGHIM